MSIRRLALISLGLALTLAAIGCKEGVDTQEAANSQKEINAQKDSDWQD